LSKDVGKDNPLRTVGKYQIVGMLAEGSMGKVYKAHDAATGAAVAVKLAAPELVRYAVLLKRFEQEFRSASKLSHPNLVRGFEFGWEGPQPFMVMELIDGEDLWTRIARLGRLSEAEAVSTITQVARGLHEAHERGIIHRDIKPHNILLTADGQAKLADLGLSKDLESEVELTRPHGGLGTPNFIAPEQFTDAKHAGVRCDIYSLGATLYMALTGRLPFAGANLGAILKAKLANELVPPRKLVPSLSERVDRAVRRALLVDPERRPASCLEFIADLTGEQKAGKSPGLERRSELRLDHSLRTICAINCSLHPDAPDCLSKWYATVQNLSVAGIGLRLSRRFEPGSLLTVDLASKSGDMKSSRPMRVVWVAPVEKEGWLVGGTLIETISQEELRLLL
jgi:serine/threonine protein kinase